MLWVESDVETADRNTAKRIEKIKVITVRNMLIR